MSVTSVQQAPRAFAIAMHRSGPLRPETATESRSRIEREVRTRLSQTRSQVSRREQHFVSLHKTEYADAAVGRPRPIRSARAEYERPAELVWRRNVRTPAMRAEEEQSVEAVGFARQSESKSGIIHQAAEVEIRSVKQAAAIQLTKLDPAIVDRLTDSVIYQVEKRMRIERQRRGI